MDGVLHSNVNYVYNETSDEFYHPTNSLGNRDDITDYSDFMKNTKYKYL